MSDKHFLNLQPGTIVNGRYEVLKCLGTGSMGMVYACRHLELSNHKVAMKVLFSEVARDEVAAARFRNEIVASYGVNHPNVVRAYEYFREGELVAFTMEYVGAGDLADRIGKSEPIPIADIVRMLIQMCSGVQAIHDAGIVHRDLKPENILITEEGDVKITDFGIAKTGSGPKLTEYGGIVGTIHYISPEYLEKGQIDHRSDIYSLGVLAYEMVTGEAPFEGNSVIETMTMRLKSDPEPPVNKRLDCPAELSEIILKSLARNFEDRYQTVHEMMNDLIVIENGLDGTSRFSSLNTALGDSAASPVEAIKEEPEELDISSIDTKVTYAEEAEGLSAVARRKTTLISGEQESLGGGISEMAGASVISDTVEESGGLESLMTSTGGLEDLMDSGSRDRVSISEDLAGTVHLDSTQVEQLVETYSDKTNESPGKEKSLLDKALDGESPIEETSEEVLDEVTTESVLAPEISAVTSILPSSIEEDQIAIGRGGLSNDRLQQLSSKVYSSPDSEGWGGLIFKLALIMIIGFLVGIYLIYPIFFGEGIYNPSYSVRSFFDIFN